MRCTALSLFLLLAMPAVTGCDRATPETAVVADGPRSHTVRGPVEVTARVDRGEVTVGEKLTLELDVAAAAGVDIEMPDVPDTLGVFAVRERRTPPDVPDGTVRRWSHAWVLDTFEPGETVIPEFEVAFVDSRLGEAGSDGAPVEGTVQTEPLSVVVRSALGGDETEADHRDIKPSLAADEFDVVRAEQARRRWIAVAVIAGAGLLLAVLLFVVRWIRRRPTPPPPPLPPHVWARAEFDALAAAGLVAAGRFEAYFVRLSGIVREYIERRFDIMAPERTTEEFLVEAHRSDVLDAGHRDGLRTFLRSADMVKFALYEPAENECDEALAAARRFVEETRSEAPTTADPLPPAAPAEEPAREPTRDPAEESIA